MAKKKVKAGKAPAKKTVKKIAKKAAPTKKASPAKKVAKVTKAKVSAKSLVKSKAPAKVFTKVASVNLSPVRSRVLIRREEGETKTAGGLYIPDVAKDKPLSGRVVAIGTGSYNKKGNKRPLEVTVGDRVLFSRYTGSQIELNGEDLLVVEEAEILGILQD